MTPLIQFILILIAWIICQPLSQRAAVPILTALGFFAITIFAPVAAVFIALTSLEAVAMVLLFARLDRKSAWRKWGAYLLLANLLFVDLHEPILGLPITTLAISFSTIRIFMTARQLLSSRRGLIKQDVIWIFAAAFYLPAIVIGPVFSGTELRKQYRANRSPAPTARDARLVLQGLVFSILLAPAFFDAANQTSTILPLNWIFLFLSLFAAFWGQSLIAEHTSRFFGIVLPVNFDKPWKATSIKDFWQRWHRSMAQFVLQYIFLPLNLRGLPPRLATVISFTFMGVWHNLSIGYLVWGACHGLLLAYLPEPGPGFRQRVTNRTLLWVIVISLSWFANYGPYS